MAIFNSLGSNYSGKFVLRSLFGPWQPQARQQLEKQLAERFDGSVTLTYKGRQALELAVRQLNLPTGSAVGINGFTCYVVYQAVERAGCKPIFIDVPDRQLNFGLAELKTAHKRYPELRAIIIQNTLGLPADMSVLADYAKKHDIAIIEDLAHSLGAKYSDGREAGMVGEMTMLSFSQDKPADVVAGGALINRRGKTTDLQLGQMGAWQRAKNQMYPFWTALIRSTYSLGLGRILHATLKKLHLMATPMSDNLSGIQQMTKTAASLLVKRLPSSAAEAEHRRHIAAIYERELPVEVLFAEPAGTPLFLRYPIWVNDREGLITALKKDRIYIGDTWYDAPIGPKRYLAKTSYQTGDCPNAEALAAHIVNLPTHLHVSEQDAHFIAGRVKAWLETNRSK